jgi:hypothetical protein
MPKQHLPSLLFFFFTRLVYTYLFFAYDILTLIMGRHKWEMNNIYEHTTLGSQFHGMDGNGTHGTWDILISREFGTWTVDFYEYV